MINKPSSSPVNIASRSNTWFPIKYSILKIAAAISLAAVACGGGKRDEFGPPDAAVSVDAQMDGGAPMADGGNGAQTDGQTPCKQDTDSDGFCDEDPREVCKGIPDLRDAMGNPVNTDGDLWPDACDKCRTQKPANGDAYHPDQDGDGLGDDMCDLDCGQHFDPYNVDYDGDGVNDALDTCPDTPNPPIPMPAPLPDAGAPADAAILPSPDDASMSLTDGPMLTPDDAGQPTDDGPAPLPNDGAPADAAILPSPDGGAPTPDAEPPTDATAQVPPTPYYFKIRIFTTDLRTKIPLPDASADSGLSANFPPPIYGGTPPPDGGAPEQQNSPRQCLPQNDDHDGDGFGKPCDINDNDPTIN